MSYIGLRYYPEDNSYCVRKSDGQPALLVQSDPEDKWYHPTNNEEGAVFTTVSEPYKETVRCVFTSHTHEFIDVKSSNTGRIYRVLFSFGWFSLEDQVRLDFEKIE